MNFSTYGWNATDGYVPPPGSIPHTLPWPAPHGPNFLTVGYNPRYQLYHGPVPVHGVISGRSGGPTPSGPVPRPVPSFTGATLNPVIPVPRAGPSPAARASTAPQAPQQEPVNPNAPPELRPGMNYMFPVEHTHLHIFSRSSRIWEDKYVGMQMNFKQFKVSTGLTVRDVILNVLRASGSEPGCSDWAVTEVLEMGDGRWSRGLTTPYSSDRATRTIGSIGWDAERGQKRPPVWLVVHKKD